MCLPETPELDILASTLETTFTACFLPVPIKQKVKSTLMTTGFYQMDFGKVTAVRFFMLLFETQLT